jgi:hypothetical protein
VAFEHRTLANGTARTDAEGVARLPVALPGMKAGVALPMELTLSRPDGTLRETRAAWAFSRDPSARPSKKIILLDDADGKTAAMLDSLGAPASSPAGTPALLANTNILAVSSSEAWVEALRMAERGAEVLVFAGGAELPLPQNMKNFTLGGLDILRDSKAPYKLALSDLKGGGLRLAAHENEVVLRPDDSATAQAAQWNFEGGGRVRVCGAPLASHWEKTPAARWLLAEMLNTGENP